MLAIVPGELMQRHLQIIGLGLTALFIVTACDSASESETSYDAESYQYKGAADPFLETSAADRAGPLSDRFDLIQAR